MISISAFSFGQSVVITAVFDGSLPSDGCSGSGGASSPKGVELYVSGTIDFADYTIETEFNGSSSGSWSTTALLDGLGVVSDKFVYLIGGGETTFAEMYPSATYLPSGPNGNGNDAYRLLDNNDVIIDQFGNPDDVAGSTDLSATWAYQDSYAKRNNGVAANLGTFNSSNWTYGGNQLFDSPNNTCAFFMSSVNFGSFTLSTNNFNKEKFSVYPNPADKGVVHIVYSNKSNFGIVNVAIFDILGKQVISQVVSDNRIDLSNLNAGVYLMRATQNEGVTTKKLIIK